MELLLYQNYYKFPLSNKALSVNSFLSFHLTHSVDAKILEIFFLMEFLVGKKLLFPSFFLIKNPNSYQSIPTTYNAFCKQIYFFLFFVYLFHYSSSVSFSSSEVVSRFHERLGFPPEMFSLSFKL